MCVRVCVCLSVLGRGGDSSLDGVCSRCVVLLLTWGSPGACELQSVGHGVCVCGVRAGWWWGGGARLQCATCGR